MSDRCSATVGCQGVTIHMEHPSHPFTVTASVDGEQVASCSFDGSGEPADFLCRWDTVPEAGKRVDITVVYGHSTYNFRGRMPDCGTETATVPPPPPTDTPTAEPPTSTPSPTDTPEVPPTATPTPEDTEPPVVHTPTPTQTPIVAPPLPTTPVVENPTPVPPPTSKPPTKVVVPPAVPSRPSTSPCREIDVKIIVRQDPATGLDHIIRIWLDSKGRLMRELDLFRNFPQLVGTVQSHDIDNWDGCWDYFVFQMKGEAGTNLWRVSTYGTVLQQLTFAKDGAYSDVTTGYDGYIAYVDASKITKADSVVSFERKLDIAGNRPQLLPDNKLLYSTDSSIWLNSPRGQSAKLNLASKWFVPIPDGFGVLYPNSGIIQLEKYIPDAGEFKVDGNEIAPNQYPYQLGDIIAVNNQIWWHPTGSANNVQITGDGSVVPFFINDPEQWKKSVNSQPDWWVAAYIRIPYQSQPSDDYLNANGWSASKYSEQ